MANLHEGHRQRLKERFLREGLDHFEPHTVLELLLFYAVPQRDTNELAHRLIARFGSLDAVFDAAFDELCAVEGIGRNTATLLKLVPDLTRRYLDSADHEQVLLTSVQAIGDFCVQNFWDEQRNGIPALSEQQGRIDLRRFYRGGNNRFSADVFAYHSGSRHAQPCCVRYLAHNHPHGLAVPSNADLAATESVCHALAAAKIRLLDHFIFAGQDYISLRDSGFIRVEGGV